MAKMLLAGPTAHVQADLGNRGLNAQNIQLVDLGHIHSARPIQLPAHVEGNRLRFAKRPYANAIRYGISVGHCDGKDCCSDCLSVR